MQAPARPSQLEQGPIVWCLLSALLFGASTPASKLLLGHVGPLLLSGILYAGAALAVSPWALRDIRTLRRIGSRSTTLLTGAVLFGGVLGPVFLLQGLSQSSAGSTALWLNLETVATALLARVFFKEHLGSYTWLAVVLIVTASVLLTPDDAGGSQGALWIVAACIAWGLDNNLTAVVDRVTPAQLTFAKGLAAAGVNLSAGLLFEPNTPGPSQWLFGLGVGASSYGVSLMLYVRGAQQLGATRSQLLFSTAPAWGLGLSWLALGEALHTTQLAAATLMAIAIWLWYRERHAHSHGHAALTHEHWHRHDDEHHAHRHDPALRIWALWHCHEHTHRPMTHSHAHRPDLHHRHGH